MKRARKRARGECKSARQHYQEEHGGVELIMMSHYDQVSFVVCDSWCAGKEKADKRTRAGQADRQTDQFAFHTPRPLFRVENGGRLLLGEGKAIWSRIHQRLEAHTRSRQSGWTFRACLALILKMWWQTLSKFSTSLSGHIFFPHAGISTCYFFDLV